MKVKGFHLGNQMNVPEKEMQIKTVNGILYVTNKP